MEIEYIEKWSNYRHFRDTIQVFRSFETFICFNVMLHEILLIKTFDPFVMLFTESEGPSVTVTSVPASLVPYSLSVLVRVSSPRPVSKVESNCSLEPLQFLNTEQTQATVSTPLMCLLRVTEEFCIYF